MPSASKIFCGFRVLGFNSNHIPLCIRYHQKHQENYVVTCVGDAFHTYNCSKLGIISISNLHQAPITCLAVDAYLVYTACGSVIQSFIRGRQVCHTYNGHTKNVHTLLPFGKHLISVDEGSNIKVWDIESEGVYLEMNFNNSTFQVTTIVHPSTYLNKVLLGSKQGQLQLWNIRTNKQLYVFPGWGQQVTATEQAPAVDVIAIGLSDGQIFLHNIRVDETLMKFRQDWGPVISITFRTDGNPVMATGSSLGHIALWNLEERRLFSQIREAHHGAVSGLKCLPNEPLMVTSSPDNSLKVWIFDQPDGGARLLRQRSGHSAPPTKVRFYGENGKNIISAGQDSTLRSFSTVHDSENKSFGRAMYNKVGRKKSGLKVDQHVMPPVIQFAAESARQSDWDNIVTCHRSIKEVMSWSYQRHTMGEHCLLHERFSNESLYKDTTARAVAISPCGNFAVIGYSSGHVDMYNMQSGIYRGSYGQPAAHETSVRDLSITSLNQLTITTGSDGIVKFWRFNSKSLLDALKLDAPSCQIALHRESSLLSVALDDFSVTIIDVDTRKVVRKFPSHRNVITDMTFSPDARWLITASMDSTVNTWNLPLGKLVDQFVCDQAVTSLSMSPSGDFLCTTHLDSLGVWLWSNKTLYTHEALHPLVETYEPISINMPSTRQEDGEENSAEDEIEVITEEYKPQNQISDELVTLSMLPSSRWQNLLLLDVIKQRNKPKQPPKVPKSAPFFLPTIPGLEMKFVSPDDATDDAYKAKLSEVPKTVLSLSEFGKLVEKATDTKGNERLMSALMELSPSSIDVELRSLSPDVGGSLELLSNFMAFLDSILSKKQNFELAVAYLALFIKLHGDCIASDQNLCESARKLADKNADVWSALSDKFNHSLCLVNYLRSAVL